MSIEFLELVVGVYLGTSVFPPNGARKLIWGTGPTSLPDVKLLTRDRGVKLFMISKPFSIKLEVRLVNIVVLTVAWLVLGTIVAVIFGFLDFLGVFSCGCRDKSCLFVKSVNVKSLYE